MIGLLSCGNGVRDMRVKFSIYNPLETLIYAAFNVFPAGRGEGGGLDLPTASTTPFV